MTVQLMVLSYGIYPETVTITAAVGTFNRQLDWHVTVICIITAGLIALDYPTKSGDNYSQ
jgi:hypothetical protein